MTRRQKSLASHKRTKAKADNKHNHIFNKGSFPLFVGEGDLHGGGYFFMSGETQGRYFKSEQKGEAGRPARL